MNACNIPGGGAILSVYVSTGLLGDMMGTNGAKCFPETFFSVLGALLDIFVEEKRGTCCLVFEFCEVDASGSSRDFFATRRIGLSAVRFFAFVLAASKSDLRAGVAVAWVTCDERLSGLTGTMAGGGIEEVLPVGIVFEASLRTSNRSKLVERFELLAFEGAAIATPTAFGRGLFFFVGGPSKASLSFLDCTASGIFFDFDIFATFGVSFDWEGEFATVL